MKTFKLFFFLLLISNSLFAQKITFYTENLKAYEGTWMYQSNDTIFKIVLKKGQKVRSNYVLDGLFGGYFLSVNGATVENYMSPIITTLEPSDTRAKIYIWATNYSTNKLDVNPNCLRFTFYDQKKKHFDGNGINAGTIKLLSPNKIEWILDEKEGIRATIDQTADPIGFSVPTDVIMIKED